MPLPHDPGHHSPRIRFLRSRDVAAVAVALLLALPGCGTTPTRPFSGPVRLDFDLSAPARVKLVIEDSYNRQVRVLIDGRLPGRSHRVVWDCRDNDGRVVPNGVYFAVLQVDGRHVEPDLAVPVPSP